MRIPHFFRGFALSLALTVFITATPGYSADAGVDHTAVVPVADNPFDSAIANGLWHLRTELAGLLITGLFIITQKLGAAGKSNVQKAGGTAHAVFNALWDQGLIKNGYFKEAEAAFWNEFRSKFIDAHDHPPDDAADSAGHTEFVQLFTEHTDNSVPAKSG